VNGALSHVEALLPKAPPDNTNKNKLDESFLDTLMRCQVSFLGGHRHIAFPSVFQMLLFLPCNAMLAQY